jgi:DNA polymerase III subunit alpha
MKQRFTHLHVHSHYSLLDGLPKIGELLDQAKELGMGSLALTDHGNLYGLIEFYQKAKQKDIKPILGCEVYVAPRRLDQKEPAFDKKPYHLTLLVENNTGYRNLVQLITKANLEGFYYHPRVDEELLAEHHSGLIALSGCLQGKIPRLILADRLDEAKKIAKKYQKIFGSSNFFLEIQPHLNLERQLKVNQVLIKLSKELEIPLVATNDVHYLKPEDAEAQDILMLINTKQNIDTPNRHTMMGEDFSLRSSQEMISLLKETPEAIENTNKIADRCQVSLELGKIKLPAFPIPSKQTADGYLAELCQKGIKEKYEKVNQDLENRLRHELAVIKQMQFASYFLIVQDFVRWAKEQHIVVGPGRGSAPGSIVSYLLDITTVDPLKYDLLFERFLSPGRISMPDIDLDFTDRRRNEVLRYVAQKYGADHVAQIITFGTMAARGAIRDVGRVLHYPYLFCDEIAKAIPMNLSLKESLQNVGELKRRYESEEKVRRLIDLAQKVEGTARHVSTHACGVVISDAPLTEIVPLQHPPQNKEEIITQYGMRPIEALGLLKMDFLGLKNLTIIEDTLRYIYAIQRKNIEIEKIPLNDKKTYRLLQKGQTTGVFQLESNGMKTYLQQLKPSKFEDIIAMVALYRPGPMQFIPQYIKRKHGKEKPSYLHPKLKPILEKTYGIAVYQEQIMQIAHNLANFSLSEADVLRKAIGKKMKKLLVDQKNKFIKGMEENNISTGVAKEIWEWIIPFARYSFNLAHAASYATIAYQTAYLKANYPLEFMAALLTSHQGDNDKISFLIRECESMKIPVLPPDINQSFRNFSVVSHENKIRFGLSAVKNVGHKIVDDIIQERKENGHFKNFEDFLERTAILNLEKKTLESLAEAGAFDQLIEREKIVNNLARIISFLHDLKEQKKAHQQSLFQSSSSKPRLNLPNGDKTSMKTKLGWEKKLLGLYISAHPLDEFKKILHQQTTPIQEITNGPLKRGQARIGGIVTRITKILTRNKQRMIFAEVEDQSGRIEVVVFPNTLEEYPQLFQENKILIIQGKINHRDNQPKLICDLAEEIISQED